MENPEDCEYDLVGVLVHSGTADSGHYYSYIKERRYAGEAAEAAGQGGGWYLFNDMHVEPFDPSEIGAGCYGGSDYIHQEGGGVGQQAVSKVVPRMYSAYMLVYERAGVSKERESMASREGRLAASREGKLAAELPLEIRQRVWRENSLFMRDKLVYDASYFNFVHKVVSMRLEDDGLGGEELKTDVFRLSVRFLMDTLMHAWDVSLVEGWVTCIIPFLSKDTHGLARCKWLLDAFVQDAVMLDAQAHPGAAHGGNLLTCHWLREGLLTCRVLGARENLVRMLHHAVSTIVCLEPQHNPDDGADIPHCMPSFEGLEGDMEHDEMPEEYLPLYAHLPLLTDSPHPRLCPGGYDPALEPPLDYTPFPRACTHVGRLMDAMLSLLPDLPVHWRNFGQFFGLLSQIAKVGLPERAFLLSRRAISRCIDVFLHEDSPLCDSHKYRFRLGDKMIKPHWEHLVEMVSDLVRSARPISEVDGDGECNDASPMALECAGTLDDACADFATNRKFITKLLADEVNPPAAEQLAVHLCWKDPKTTNTVVQVVCGIVEETSDEDFPHLFRMLSVLVVLQDGHERYRADKIAVNFLRAVSENIQYHDICTKCIEFLAQVGAPPPPPPRRRKHSLAVTPSTPQLSFLQRCSLLCTHVFSPVLLSALSCASVCR